MSAEETRENDATAENKAQTGSATEELILLPVRGLVLFPGLVLPIALRRKQSLAAAQEAVHNERPMGVILQDDEEENESGPDGLRRVGTVGNILRYVTGQDGEHHLICQGEQRFRILEFTDNPNHLQARVERLNEPDQQDKEIEARVYHLKQQAVEALKLLPQAPDELINAIQNIESASQLADMIASYMDLKADEKQQVLETLDIRERLDKVRDALTHRIEVLRLTRQISQQTRESVDENQREYMLREQLKTIQQELGEGDEKSAEIEDLRKAVDAAQMPKEADRQARKELKRLERMPEGAGEYSMVRTYLDWLVELPWAKLSEQSIDIDTARAILDEDHYDLDRVKRRILEHLAVRKLNPEGASPILCFVGPPGVGKTSLGQSIARAMGREFVRGSLGGTHDESEIRGHRRTYLGALPGNIIQNIHKAGTRNPVFMLDEIDKLGAGGLHGDPSSALLEVLDPAQNEAFRDNYLGVDFDLSKVMFIATANVMDTIPGPLRDRMEVIELPGYTEDEKVQIAGRYMVDRQRKAAGLVAKQCEIPEDTLHAIVRDYTREAGCRNLEREIGAICRRMAMHVAEGKDRAARIQPNDLPDILGPRKFENEVRLRTSVSGVATGLAWTPAGGDILFIEASRSPGSGQLILTGQLGDVMKESAQAALSLVKNRAQDLGVDAAMFEKNDIHVHVPAGAIPKDGPSAGVAMFTALASLLANHTVRADTAMTGEITLRGMVLPIGGVKEKCLAALRAGITRVVLPQRNQKEFDDIPENARQALEFRWVSDVDAVLDAVLEPE